MDEQSIWIPPMHNVVRILDMTKKKKEKKGKKKKENKSNTSRRFET